MACVLAPLLFTLLPTETSSSADLVPGVSLFDVLWGHGDGDAELIDRSSSFLEALRSGRLTESCYARFLQQEALYLRAVSGALEAPIGRLREAGDVRSLLLDTFKDYTGRNQSLPPPPPPPPRWLQASLHSFHSLVSEEPVYWLVALSARACLRNYLGSGSPADPRLREWSKGSRSACDRFRTVIDEHRSWVDTYRALNVFKQQMQVQKRFYQAVDC